MGGGGIGGRVGGCTCGHAQGIVYVLTCVQVHVPK